MKIAVEGCCHGALDKIYETLEHLEKKENIKVDLLLCCGDFQAVRNEADLSCMAVPPKYRHMETFYKYYSGEKNAPVLTVFIGGNHEATNHLWELPYGGWVAPNVYYLGYCGVINYGGFRIGGLSGIYKGHDFNKGHFEKPPYNESTVRSAYHVRSFDVFMLKLISQPIDIFMSHDWPVGVYHHGNLEALYKYKEFLRPEIENNTLGSPPAGELLTLLKPKYWFAAHLHAKFPALVPHECQDGVKFTKFLALDKCLPRREFLQVIDVGPATAPLELTYDPEWLAITKLTNALNNLTPRLTVLPSSEQMPRFRPDDKAIEDIVKVFGNPPKIPENFQITTAPYNPEEPKKTNMSDVFPVVNPQTEIFCSTLGIINPCYPEKTATRCPNPEEIDLSDGDDDIALDGNPDEIDIGDDDDESTVCKSYTDNNISANSMNKPNQNRSRLELPRPMNSRTGDIHAHHSVNFTDDKSLPDNKTFECKEPEGVFQDNSVVEPQKKAMKLTRRNQSLYTSNDDEQDSDN